MLPNDLEAHGLCKPICVVLGSWCWVLVEKLEPGKNQCTELSAQIETVQ